MCTCVRGGACGGALVRDLANVCAFVRGVEYVCEGEVHAYVCACVRLCMCKGGAYGHARATPVHTNMQHMMGTWLRSAPKSRALAPWLEADVQKGRDTRLGQDHHHGVLSSIW